MDTSAHSMDDKFSVLDLCGLRGQHSGVRRKQRKRLAALVALLVAVPVAWQQSRQRPGGLPQGFAEAGTAGSAAPGSASALASPAVGDSGAKAEGDRLARKRNRSPAAIEVASVQAELADARRQLEVLSRPLHSGNGGRFSSVVRAEIANHEVLVLGGYQTQDNRCQFTFASPRWVSQDGLETMVLQAHVVEMGADAAADFGLDSLATNARNTLQHAQAWDKDEALATLKALKDVEGVRMLAAPAVMVAPRQEFTVSVGGYALAGHAEKSADGDGAGFLLTIREEMTPAGE